MGWISAFGLAGLVFAILRQSRWLPREALEIVAAALIVALAGYAWQGSPDMPGKPVEFSQSAR